MDKKQLLSFTTASVISAIIGIVSNLEVYSFFTFFILSLTFTIIYSLLLLATDSFPKFK